MNLKKFLLSFAMLTFVAVTAVSAQETKDKKEFAISDYLKISGNLDLEYDNLHWKQNDGSMKETSTFNLRRGRLVASGNITKQLEFKFQLEMASNPRILDAYMKLNLHNSFQIRIGQGKIPFTIENPYAPSFLTIDNTQVINALSGMGSDPLIADNKYGGGREMGVAIMGGFIEREGYSVINYNIGIFNGNGINVKNDNLSFAYVGQLEIKPIKDLKFHASAYLGEYKLNDSVEKALRNRYAVGAEYSSKTWMLRSEYVWGVTELNDNPAVLASTMNQKSDGFYAQAAYNFYLKCKNGKTQTLYPVVRYDYYAKNSEVNAGKSTYWLAGIGWWPEKHLRFQLNYTLRHEIGKENLGHYVAAQATVKF